MSGEPGAVRSGGWCGATKPRSLTMFGMTASVGVLFTLTVAESEQATIPRCARDDNRSDLSVNGAGGGEELLGAGADANVFGEVLPADGAGEAGETPALRNWGGAGETPFGAPFVPPFVPQGKQGKQGKQDEQDKQAEQDKTFVPPFVPQGKQDEPGPVGEEAG